MNVAVTISTPERPDRIGVTRDLSTSGMLFHSLSRFAVGDRDETIVGEVVRAGRDAAWDLYPNATAVTFEAGDAQREASSRR